MRELHYYLSETLGLQSLLKKETEVFLNEPLLEEPIAFLWVHLKAEDSLVLAEELFNNILLAFHNELAKTNSAQMNSALLDVTLEEWLQVNEEISNQTHVILMHPLLLSSMGQKPSWPYTQIHSLQQLTQQPLLKKQAWKSLQQIIKSLI